MIFWHDGIPQYKMFDDNHNVSYCCVAPKPAGVSCYLWCPLECTPAGRITRIFSDPSRQDMPVQSGSGGSCPPGALSPAIGNLAELSSLVFRHSCLAGDLPDSVTRLQKLTEIVMPENNFSGPIPPGLFRLPALRHVDLSTLSTNPEFQLPYEGLSGSLPDGPDAYSPSLVAVILSGNALSGDLPRALLRAPALRRLDLQSNNITGELPGEAGAYSRSIIRLILRNNSLSGAIPPALAEMTALRKLDLGENRLSGAVPAALRDSESLKVLDEVRLDSNTLTGPFCDALLPASELWLGFNDLGGATAGSSASATVGGGGGGGGEADEGGSLHGCVLPAKLERLSAPHAGLLGSVPPDLFLVTNAQSGRKPSMGGLGRIIGIDLSHNSLSSSLRAFTVLPSGPGDLDLSHNNFSGGIPDVFFSYYFWLVDLRFNELSGPLFDTRRVWSYDWDVLRVSNNSARMAGAVGAGYLPTPAPGVQASAVETAALLAVRDALLGEGALGTVGAAVGGTALVNGGNGSWAEILRSWDACSSSACAWYGVGCTADGHVDTLHLIGASNVTLHPNFVPESPECEYDHAGSARGSLSEALGQLTQLTSLRISGHALSGGLPPSLSRLSHLVALDLSSNRHLSGSIPPALLTLPSLRELSLRGNNLTGEVGLLTGLTRLALDHNRLDGSLPQELRALWMLRDLQLQGNALQGDIAALATASPPPAAADDGSTADSAASSAPVSWGLSGVFPLLTRLDVSSNELSGDAATLSPLQQYLHTLNVSHNRLTCGPFNASWNARYMDLSHNRISAPLQSLFPLSDGIYSSVLRLSHNQLTGPIPATLLQDKVTDELDLSHNLLTGSVPAIVNLHSLETLDLSFNQLSGTIPNLDVFLIRCDLSHNRLTGEVPPPSFVMEYLNASWNKLDGMAQWDHSQGMRLKSLDASHNAMAGNLPDLGHRDGLMSLTYLDFSYNAFTGTLAQKIYPFFKRATGSGKVEPAFKLEVGLSHNELTGSIPSIIFSSNISLLDLSHNQFSGPIPDPPQGNGQSSSLVPLSHLDLSSNKLTGSISNALVTGLAALSHLDLSANLLSGSLPRSLTLAPTLTDLNLSRNKLKGSLLAFCQGKQRLASLLLSSNAFSGPLSSLLPSSSSSCASSLLSLNVSSNQLSGSLPSSLSRFTALHSLLAARNRMSGSIPAGLASLTGLQELDMLWSGLSGTIPARLRAAAPSLQVHLAGNALSGSVPPSLSDLPTSCFRPGNPKLCGKPLPDCKKRSAKPRKGRFPRASLPPIYFHSTLRLQVRPPDLPSTKSTFRTWRLPDHAATVLNVTASPIVHSHSNPHVSRFSYSIMASIPRALPSPLPVPSRLTLITLLALIALLRQAEAYTPPPIPDGCVAEIAEVDREAMRAVYAALPENMFFWHDGIPQYKLFDDNHNVSYCCVAPKPAGVSCYLWCPLECTPAGRITRIFSDPSRQDMPVQSESRGSCPPGALSPAIGDLAELSSLVFRHSSLAGDLPDSVTRLQKLTTFAMPENNFSGPIPPGLFRLPALRHVDLSTISPHSYLQLQYEGRLPALRHVNLTPPEGIVGLSGSLPDGPDAYSPSLEEVILSGNALSGELPRALLRAPALRQLDLQSNNFTGELPGEAGAYSRSIAALSLRNNSLSGAIPSALAEMTALQKLDLGWNRLSGAVPAALRDSESLKALKEVRLDHNALTGPFCDALLPASDLWLGFNDLGGATAGSSASATSGGGGSGGGEEEEGGSLHGCVLPAKLEILSAPHAGLRGSVPHDLFLAMNAQTGRKPSMGGLGRTIRIDLSHNSLSGSLRAFTVLPYGVLDLSHNNFSGGIPEVFYSEFSRVDVRFNELSGPLFDARREAWSRGWSYDWDRLRVSNNSARMAGAVGAGYLPAPAPGVQASAAETAALLAVRDALLGEAAGGAVGGAAGEIELVNGRGSSWAEMLRSWDASNSSACAWHGVGCTADGHVDTLHLIGNSFVYPHTNYIPESPECEDDQYGDKVCAHDVPPPPPRVRYFLQGLPGGSSNSSGSASASASGSLSEALGQLTHLTSLCISGHALSGGLPPSLSSLSHLVSLNLSSNRQLSGSIPPGLFALPSLRELSLLGNNLTGEVLPTTTAGAAGAAGAAVPLSPSLESLDVGGNALSGSIAAQVGLLTGLTRLALDQNQLEGSLPRELGALWMLRDLHLQGNALRGDVSALAAAFPSPAAAAAAGSTADSTAASAAVLWGLSGVFPLLARLDVSSNELSGDAATLSPLQQYFHTLNVSHNRLTCSPGNASWNAYYMDLSHNRISAPLKDLFGKVDSFDSTVLRLSHNQLSGPIPAMLLRNKVQGELDLSHNLLTGSIPAIVNLYSMKTLDLAFNQLSGTIPQLHGSLITCDFSHNRLTGKVPPAPPAMQYLNVSWNQLDGMAQWQYQEGRRLKSLDASHNAMAGNLPDLGNSDGLMSLTYLDLSYNAFTGTLLEKTYPFLEQATSFTGSVNRRSGVEVRLSHNKLTGSISSFVFSSSPSLLDLSHNQFSGPIPDAPQGNSQGFFIDLLSYLDLSSNKLSGTISDALVTGLTALSHLDLSDNLLSGLLPRSLAAVPPLTHLDLSRNKLKGSLPAFCQGNQSLASLLLSSNAFSGPLSSLLPSSSSCASSLLSLGISNNQLSGSLPSSLSCFTALQSLLAARNRMSGSIPAGLASLTALQELDVSWSGLSGTIPALLRAAAPSLQVQLAGNALSGAVPPSLSDLPTSCFRPGNPKLCGKPLPDCKKSSSKPRKGRV
ncbi:unnamed protein product [Closterium sp. Yama58-4]|nr:unnamed protein product [Closterium sp. Yama58-4]